MDTQYIKTPRQDYLMTVVVPDDLKYYSVEEVIDFLELHGISWDIGNTGNFREARIWDWPFCIGRHRPIERTSTKVMLIQAIEAWQLRAKQVEQGIEPGLHCDPHEASTRSLV